LGWTWQSTTFPRIADGFIEEWITSLDLLAHHRFSIAHGDVLPESSMLAIMAME
jgi:hypothetical protein